MSKKATTRDVAEMAAVSRTTVSFVLNDVPGMRISEETRKRVLAAARRLDYHPDAAAVRMVTGRSSTIGVISRQHPNQVSANQFLPQILYGVAQAAAANNYHVLFKPIASEGRTNAYTQVIRERHVDGFVVFLPRCDDLELQEIHAEGEAVVIVGQLPDSTIPCVDIDNVAAAKQAVQHLIDLGHRDIGLITNAGLVYASSANRLQGYQEALAAADLSYDESSVCFGEFTPRSGYSCMQTLLARPSPPSAVFVASDTLAEGALYAIQEQGLRVPQDIAVVGFDDLPASEFTNPPLTTIRVPAFGLGWGAAELLLRLIASDEETDHKQVILETDFVVRESCGATLAQNTRRIQRMVKINEGGWWS